MKRLGVLSSTRGSNLAAIFEAISHQQLSASIEVVISNKEAAPVLAWAASQQLTAQFIDPKECSREAYDAKVSALLKAHRVELVVLVGYMRILSADFVREWAGRIINVHPSLLPAFAGKMDLEVHRAVLASGAKRTGCTVHLVTEALDAGPILLQKTCEVLSGDTPERLKSRVQALEASALVEVIRDW